MLAIIVIVLWAAVLGAGLAWVALSLALPAFMKGSRWRAVIALPFLIFPAAVTVYLAWNWVQFLSDQLGGMTREQVLAILGIILITVLALRVLVLILARSNGLDQRWRRVMFRIVTSCAPVMCLAGLTVAGIYFYRGGALSGWNWALILILDGLFVCGVLALLRARWWRYPAAILIALPAPPAPPQSPSVPASEPVPAIPVIAALTASQPALPLKLYGRLMGAMALFLLLHFGALWIGNLLVTSDFAAQRIETHAALAALLPDVPAAENAFTHYRRAYDLNQQHVLIDQNTEWQKEFDFDQLVVYHHHPAATATVEYIRDQTTKGPDSKATESLGVFLARHQEDLQEMRAGAALAALRTDSLQFLGAEDAQQDVKGELFGGWLDRLQLDVHWQLSQGQSERAVQDANCLFGLGKQVTQSYGIIGILIGEGHFCTAVSQLLQPILNDPGLTPEAAAAIQLPPALWLETQLPLTAVVEEDLTVDKVQKIPFDAWTGSRYHRVDSSWYCNWYLDGLRRVVSLPGMLVEYRRQTAECSAVVNGPYYKTHFAAEQKAKELDRHTAVPLGLEDNAPVNYCIIQGQAAGGDAYVAAASAAVAVVRYRMSHGKYPERLEDCVPEFLPAVPLDPFNGGPIRMKAVEGGMILYSVGGDGKDDGGRDEVGLTGDETSDVAVYLGSAYQDHLERVRKQQEKDDRR